ncbi:hypothetical protein [Reyranella sp. CPCC 100927]|uniref:hypothetical protein n=1 Tax=Reyranella sp. CPCC 100927 TaxID=2599616 RepID=UPI0011B5A4C5|nr:hypothetical protein [Reyranella sp. CPCC 100927]TWT02091.1 hypothetical protein FQU96_31430 [Reyranella sp. CPCC 100927]
MLTSYRRVVAGLLLLVGVAWMSSAAAQTWTDVIAPDLRFKVEMPAPVERATADEKEAWYAGPRTVYQAALNGQNFDFDHIDYKPDFPRLQDSKAMVLELGRGVAEKAFPKDKYKYIRDEAFTLEGWDGYALDIETEKGDGVMMRTVLVKNRLYRLLASYAADDTAKAAAKRFVDSFKVSETR